MVKIGHFPDYVNENAARWVAFFVVILTAVSFFFPESYLVVPLSFGFLARTLYGPRYSPTAQFVLKILIPFLKVSNKEVPGPPKRFAQLVGFLFSFTAICLLWVNHLFAYKIVLGILLFFASLESFLGFCAGCFAFGLMMKIGLIPEDVCERCNNINYGENI